MSKPKQRHAYVMLSTPIEELDTDLCAPLLKSGRFALGPTGQGGPYLKNFTDLGARLYTKEDDAWRCVDAHRDALRELLGSDRSGRPYYYVHTVRLSDLLEERFADARQKFVEEVYGGFDLRAMADRVAEVRGDFLFDPEAVNPAALGEPGQYHFLLALGLLEQAHLHLNLARIAAEQPLDTEE